MSDHNIIEVKTTGRKLSHLLWQHYGRRRIDGILEKVLEINHGLSASLDIPIGTKIKVPFHSDVPAPKAAEPVRIWS